MEKKHTVSSKKTKIKLLSNDSEDSPRIDDKESAHPKEPVYLKESPRDGTNTIKFCISSKNPSSRNTKKDNSPRDEKTHSSSKSPSPRRKMSIGLGSKVEIKESSDTLHKKGDNFSKPIINSHTSLSERKNARRSRSANDAIPKTSISMTILEKNKKYSEKNSSGADEDNIGLEKNKLEYTLEDRLENILEKITIENITNDDIYKKNDAKNNNKVFRISVVECEDEKSMLFIKPKCYTTFDLVRSDYKGVEVIDKNLYYIIYSKLGFGIHCSIHMMDGCMGEQDTILLYKNYFPIVVKCISHDFSTKEFMNVFQTLLYSIFEHKNKMDVIQT